MAGRRVAMTVTVAVVVGLTGIGGAAAATAGGSAGGPGDFTTTAAAQVAALQQIKTSLTPAERKLDSRLVVAERQRAAKSATAALPRLRTRVSVRPDGTTAVDIAAAAVSKDLLARLDAVGARVVSSSERLGTVRAQAPLGALTQIASWGDVRSVSMAGGYLTAGASAVASAVAGQGSVVSEGDKAEAADKARRVTHVTGVGVKVCVLSDGVNDLAESQSTGDLPAVDVLPGQEGNGNEGTAMLEIVHDLAPSAALGFATADPSESAFADNIRALRFDAHCDVIVDDILYFHEDPFQDGAVAQAVNAVTADGAIYFSSAGNEGNVIDGTSGNYEGDFVSSGRTVGKVRGVAHDFDPGPGVQVFDPISDESVGVPTALWWADPLGKAKDDYDLYLFDAAGNVLAFSQNVQDGTQDPFEILGTTFDTGMRLAVVKFSGAARYFQLSALRGRFKSSADGLTAYATSGVTRGHSAAVNAFSVAAAPAADPFPRDLEDGDPPNPAGPFPKVFIRSQKPERFTSDGPRRMFFNANGSAITPGNFTSTGGTVRQKPDITAADGVSTSVPGFAPFFGTSAAAPHAAAIAALVLSGNPGATSAQLRQAFNATALDLAPAGRDNRTGVGIVRADLVLANTGATPRPLVRAGSPTITVTSGDGDAFLEHGETARVALPVTNVGDGPAVGVGVQVSTDSPLATITPTTQSYPAVPAGRAASRNFTLKLAPTYPKGKPVALAVTVAFDGVLSPTTATARIPTGQPAAGPQTFAYTGPPIPIPDDDATGVSLPFTVGGIGYASRLTFSVDGTACNADEGATTVGIDHTFVEDLVGTLTAPDGATATLFSRSGHGGNNLCQVVFDDAAAEPFAPVEAVDAPFTGSWQPADPLSTLLVDPVDGTWTFSVADTAAADTGSVRAVSLHIAGFAN